MEQLWFSKQQELLSTVKVQAGQIQQKLERLTDCYVEGGLDKETFEQRKAQLLIEFKTKEIAEKELIAGKSGIIRKAQKFLELVKDLTNSYKNGILAEQRELVEIVTSNLLVEGKKLVIAMRSPFLELSQRWFFPLGDPTGNRTRL